MWLCGDQDVCTIYRKWDSFQLTINTNEHKRAEKLLVTCNEQTIIIFKHIRIQDQKVHQQHNAFPYWRRVWWAVHKYLSPTWLVILTRNCLAFETYRELWPLVIGQVWHLSKCMCRPLPHPFLYIHHSSSPPCVCTWLRIANMGMHVHVRVMNMHAFFFHTSGCAHLWMCVCVIMKPYGLSVRLPALGAATLAELWWDVDGILLSSLLLSPKLLSFSLFFLLILSAPLYSFPIPTSTLLNFPFSLYCIKDQYFTSFPIMLCFSLQTSHRFTFFFLFNSLAPVVHESLLFSHFSLSLPIRLTSVKRSISTFSCEAWREDCGLT